MGTVDTSKSSMRQIRIENLITTSMDDTELDAFVADLSGQISTQLQQGSHKGEAHVLSTYLDMENVSEDETNRLQSTYDEAVSGEQEEAKEVSSKK